MTIKKENAFEFNLKTSKEKISRCAFLAKCAVLVAFIGAFFIFAMMGWDRRTVWFDFDFLSLASFLLFAFFLLISLKSERVYWFVFPFILLIVPNAINDLIPSISMGVDYYYIAPKFSYFTHVDVFLLIGVIRYCDFSKSVKYYFWFILFFLLSMLAWSATAGLFDGYFWVKLMGGFQLRYALFMTLLFMFSEPSRYYHCFFKGLIIGLLWVCFEALIFSFLKGPLNRLASGNFGVNPLGHLMAGGSALTLLSVQKNSYRWLLISLSVIFILACFATGTRFSLITLLVSVFVVWCIKSHRISNIFYGFLVLLFFSSLFFIFSDSGRSLAEGVFSIFQGSFNLDNIERNSETSSMLTRLLMWERTLNMIFENSLNGVGPGVWSYLKSDYGIPYESLLDPHNDLINYLVSYGVFWGVGFYCLIFVFPIVNFLRIKGWWDESYIFGVSAFLLCLAIAGLTNAVTYKHQVFALAIYASLVILAGKWRGSNRDLYDK